MVNIAIIDSQHIFREGLESLIGEEHDIQITASEKKFSHIDEERLDETDLFLVDIEALNEERSLIDERVVQYYPDKKIVALSNETERSEVTKAVLAGSHGFLLKEMSYPNFVQAIRMIAKNGAFIHPHVLHHVIQDYRELSQGNNITEKKQHHTYGKKRVCTARENEILQLLVDGHDNNSIADELSISEKTVKNHLTNIFRKLDVKDRTQAAVLAIRNNWVEF